MNKTIRCLVLVGLVGIVLFGVSVPGESAQAPERYTGNPIRLLVGTFVPVKGETLTISPELAVGRDAQDGPGYHIVQFQGPIYEEWKAAVISLGGTVLDYIPDFAFVVYMDEATRARVEKLAEVVWIGPYEPAYKLSPDLADADGLLDLNVQTFPTEPVDAVLEQLVQLGAQVQSRSQQSIGGLMRLTIDASHLDALARVPAVRWIEPFYERVLFNDVARSSTIMDAETVWSDLGLYGAGQVVAVSDTGLDTGSLSTLAQDFLGSPTGCTGTGRIKATFALGRTNNWSDSCGTSSGGHGTHVTGSVLGNGCRSGSTGMPSYGGSYAGLAPQAGLVFQSVMDSSCGLGGLPTDLNDLFAQAQTAGAHIHTNSWGAAVSGQYTTDSQNTDEYMWNHKEYTILFAAGNEGIDSNSDGFIDSDSMSAPGTAKNCITVGGSENYRLTGGLNPGGPCSTWGTCWSDYPVDPINSDRISDNEDGMMAFSSRGPTDGGRLKPDVVAPGSNILSTKSQAATGVGSGWGAGPSQYYQYMGGTSMSTPLTAGAVALIRDWYTDIEGVTPSSALIKATLINSAVNIHPGQYSSPLEQQPQLPNSIQGWGRVNVANATDGSHAYHDIADGSGLQTGGSHTYNYEVCTAPTLKVTLVWTDYPGTTVSGGALVNNLNLTVTAPDSTVYRGNVFTNGWSTSGGSADSVNNVESIYLQSPAAGEWTITVSGYNVPQGTRPGYALVVDMPDNYCSPDFTLAATPESQGACVGADALYSVAMGEIAGFGGSVTLSTSGLPTGATESWSVNPINDPPGSSVLTIGTTGVTAGTYTIDLIGTAGALTHQDNVTLNLSAAKPGATALSTPLDGATGVALTPTFMWSNVANEAGYTIEIATDPDFATIVRSAALAADTTSYSGAMLGSDTVYYWRVWANNACGAETPAMRAFRTAAPPACTELLLYPGFEGGRNVGWSESSTGGYAVVTTDYPRSGSYSAWMGGASNETSQVWQSVTIDPGATSVMLNYWYWISSTRTTCNANERAEVRINGMSVRTNQLCSTTNTGGFVAATAIDLSAYSGATELRFWADTDNQLPHSSFLVDDVSIEQCLDVTPTTADYSDLSSSYGIAWHTGSGALRLGTLWTADTGFAPGTDDSDDGVSFPSGLKTGLPSTVRVNVQGTGTNGRWLRLWFDWNGDGTFDLADGELEYDGTVANGDNDITVNVPAGQPQAPYYRARLYDSTTGPSGIEARDADSFGQAAGGEVEDGQGPAPTAVELTRFEGWPEGLAIHVEWETVTEIDNLGFNLYRANAADGSYAKLNDEMIPSQAPGSPMGWVYVWLDAAVEAGQTYYYLLEDVDIYGHTTTHGPIQVKAGPTLRARH